MGSKLYRYVFVMRSDCTHVWADLSLVVRACKTVLFLTLWL